MHSLKSYTTHSVPLERHRDPPHLLPFLNDQHLEPVSDLDVTLGRSGESVRHERGDFGEVEFWASTGDDRRRIRGGRLVLLVDLRGGEESINREVEV